MSEEKIIHMDMGQLNSEQHSENAILCLGIESSCDETSAALVDSDRNILAHIIYSQIPEHQKFGGVVPELAARAHILAIDAVINQSEFCLFFYIFCSKLLQKTQKTVLCCGENNEFNVFLATGVRIKLLFIGK